MLNLCLTAPKPLLYINLKIQSIKVSTYIYSTGISFDFCIITIFHYYNNL